MKFCYTIIYLGNQREPELLEVLEQYETLKLLLIG